MVIFSFVDVLSRLTIYHLNSNKCIFSNECWARTCHSGIRLSSFRNIYKKFYWFYRGLRPLEVTGNCIGGFSDANCKSLPNYYYIPRVNKLYMPKCIDNTNCAQMLNHA